ncbi:MAG: hypothetical protein KTR14_10595 [Vampirovibrio sp.]|nr:hypothetical protein [Vampirovibrio sp.]
MELNSSYILSKFNSVFTRYDDEQDGLDRTEIAEAILDHNTTGNPVDRSIAGLLSTFLVGGNDSFGLFFDPNQDGKVQLNEMEQLAAMDGNDQSFSGQDFQAAFPGQNTQGGRGVNLNEIQLIAGPNYQAGNPLSRPSNPYFPGQPPVGMPPTPGPGYPPAPPQYPPQYPQYPQQPGNPGMGNQQGMIQMMNQFLQLMLQMLPLLNQQRQQ